MRKRYLGLIFVAIAAVFSAIVYSKLPARMVTHFDVHGKPDGYMNKLQGAFAIPVVALFFVGLFNVLPRAFPRRENVERFNDTYWFICNFVIAFTCAINIAGVGYNLGWPINMTSFALFSIGMLFIVLGNVLPRTRSNWLMGIRTPWTLDSETVWRETHRLGGRTFMIGGIVTIIAAFLPARIQPWVAMAALTVAGFIPVIYSYMLWRGEKRGSV